MDCRVILRKRFIRFADFVRHRHLIDVYIPASLLACAASCIYVVLNNRDAGIWAERPSLLSSLLAALLWAWLGIVNVATRLVSCCDLYYNELVSPFFKRTGKRRKRVFFLCLCVIAVNARLKMSLVSLNYLNCQSWTEWKVLS